jgi:heme exporter protein D
MGGYGAYIWPSYGIAAAVMLGLLLTSLRAMRARRRELAVLEGEGRARRRTRQTQGQGPAVESGDDPETP